MANVKFKKGLTTALPTAKKEGQVYFSLDSGQANGLDEYTGNLWFDYDANHRVKINKHADYADKDGAGNNIADTYIAQLKQNESTGISFKFQGYDANNSKNASEISIPLAGDKAGLISNAAQTIKGDKTFANNTVLHRILSEAKESSSHLSKIIVLPMVTHDVIGTASDELYFKGLIKWICENYQETFTIFIGSANPNSQGILFIHIYSTTDVNEEGYPNYANGTYFQLNGRTERFGFYKYEWWYSPKGYASEADKAKEDGLGDNIAEKYISTLATTHTSSNKGTQFSFRGYDGNGSANNNEIIIPGATGSQAGLITTGTQAFAGNKTFTGQAIFNGGSDAAAATADTGKVIVGSRTGPHLAIDENEIMAKTNATTAGILVLNNDGGLVQTGGDISALGGKVSLGNGTYHINTETSKLNNLQLSNKLFVNINNNGNDGGISLYGASDPMNYGLAMRTTSSANTHGYVTGDWATYFSMNGASNRGWIFNHSGVRNVASINTDGKMWLNSNLITSGVGKENSYIAYPIDGTYATASGEKTGYLKITLPQSWTSTMLRFKISVYNYSPSNNSIEYLVGGYNYSGSGGKWVHSFAQTIGQYNYGLSNLTVRFGHDGEKCAIYIGEADTKWSYPQISISDITIGYSNFAQDKWMSGWNIDFVTELGTITQTVSNTNIAYASHMAEIATYDSSAQKISSTYLANLRGSGNGTSFSVIGVNGDGTDKVTVQVPNATASKAGLITTGAQTIAGNKTLNGILTLPTASAFNYSGIETAGQAGARPVWFAHASKTGTPVYNTNFNYDPATGVLSAAQFNGLAAKATADGTGNNIADTYVSTLATTHTDANKGTQFSFRAYDGNGSANDSEIVIPGATVAQAGLVTTGAQTLTGAKTLDASGSLTINGINFNYAGIEQATANAARVIWFSDSATKGKPVYNGNFTYNPSTGTVTAAKFNGLASKATADGTGQSIVNTYLSNVTVANSKTLKKVYGNGNEETIGNFAPLNASNKIDLTYLPNSVLERITVVANDEDRFKLTTATVQNGDVVKVTATNKMYMVKDDTKLTTEAGYEEFKVGSAASVPWSGITSKPSLLSTDTKIELGSDNISILLKRYDANGSALAENKILPKFLPLAGGTVTGQTIFNTGADVGAAAANSGAIIIGNPTGAHIGIDSNEIMAKSNGTTATTLILNHEGGLVQTGGNVRVVGGNLSLGASDSYYINTATSLLNSLKLNNKLFVNYNSSGNDGGISLYGTADPLTYGIAMRTTSSAGTHGYVTNDWATYFSMNNTNNRGWIFKKGTVGNVASISNDGKMWLNGNLITSGVGKESSYIAYPTDGIYRGGKSAETGYLKVTLPRSWTSTMLKFKVSIYNYATSSSTDYIISGYNYNNGDSSNWISCSARAISPYGHSLGNLTVRFGHDGEKCAIYIGEVDTKWSYPQVSISDITVGFLRFTQNEWISGWNISFVTELGTIKSTITNTNIAYSSHISDAATQDSARQTITATYLANLKPSTSSNGTYFGITGVNGNGSDKVTVQVPNASASVAGLITTGAQTLTGIKTLDANGGLTITGKSKFNFSGIEQGTSEGARPVWFSYLGQDKNGTPVINNSFTYEPVSRALNIGKLNLNRDSGTNFGRISWYRPAYHTWVDYMSDAKDGSSPTGGKPSTLGNVSSWAIRSLIQDYSGYGWLWESTTEGAASETTVAATPRMALSAVDGQLTLNGHFQFNSNGGQVRRAGNSVSWANGRDGAILRQTSFTGYNPILSMKTTDGDWSLGVYTDNKAYMTYITDANYNASNIATAQMIFYPDGYFYAPYIGANSHNTSYKLSVGGASNLGGDVAVGGHIYPGATNTYYLGTASRRWKGLLIGTTNTYGNNYRPIYWNNGVPTQVSYDLNANVKGHAGSLASGGWKALNGNIVGPYVTVAYNNNPAIWNSGTYSSSIVFGANDTKGLLDCAYHEPIITFGGGSKDNSTDDNPKWYFKLKGTSAATYTLPSNSKTLAASDGSNASGNWNINAASATKLQTARTIFGKSFDGTANIGGQGLFYGRYYETAGSRYSLGGLQIRENDMVGNTQSDDAYAPAIGFHWANRVGGSIILASNGKFKLLNGAWGTGVLVANLEGKATRANLLDQNTQLTYGLTGLQYFNQTTSTTSGANVNANPTSGWYHILRMNHGNNQGYFVDLAAAFYDDDIQYRRIVAGTEYGWTKLLDSKNYNDYALPLTGGTVTGQVILNNENDAAAATANSGILLIGNPAGHHLTMDGDEIMSKSSGTAASTLYLNHEGEAVSIGPGGLSTSGLLNANGRISITSKGSTWVSGMTLTNASISISTKQTQSNYHPYFAVKTSSDHVVNLGGLGDQIGFYGFKAGRTANATDWNFYFNASNGNVTSTGSITAPNFYGTASKLAGFKVSATTNLGIDSTDVNQAIGYVSDLTAATWNGNHTDGAMYRQVYSAAWIHQIFGDYRTGQIAVRGKNGGAWTAWRTVLDSTNYTNYAPSKTGSGASGNWGINITGSAAKLTTPRSIAISGGATGTATNFDGSANISIPVTEVKEAYLAWGGKNHTSSYGPIDAAMIPELGANRLAFIPAAAVEIQYSTNGGSTWSNYSTTDANKINLFNGLGAGYTIGGTTAGSIDKTNYQLRITITTNTANLYTVLNKFCIYCSTNGSNGCWCTIDAKTKANVDSGTDTWVTFANKSGLGGWSGYNIINTSGLTTYGNSSWQYQKVRFTFGVTSHPSSVTYGGLTIYRILGFGGVGWNTPSTMAATGRMYTYDYAKNVTFPAKVTATSFSGNASSATKLQTARTINGTSFDGSANITTANWGTSRTISISDTAGTTGTSVNGSANATLVMPKTVKGFQKVTSENVTVTNDTNTKSLTMGASGKQWQWVPDGDGISLKYVG